MHHFEQMPGNAKAWVYAANRILTPGEQAAIRMRGEAFVAGWTAHQMQLKASFDILHDLFIIMMVDIDVNEVSGCGIDKSVHFVQEIAREFNIELFNRLQVELLQNDAIIITSKAAAIKLFQELPHDTELHFFNKSVTTKEEFDSSFMIPFTGSWVYQSLAKTTAQPH